MRSSGMSFDFLSKQGRDAWPDLVQRQYFSRSLQFRRCFGHPVHSAGGAILRNGMMPLFMQDTQPFSAVSSHPREDHPNDITAPKIRDTFEKDIHRRAIR